MAISNKTRKLLWGRSGNLCAICKCELARQGKEVDDNVVIGDECHIVAKKPGGPRGDPTFPEEYLDHYQNLILLCKVHHKVIDDQPNSYSTVALKKLKAKHEEWVRNNLHKDKANNQKDKLKVALRILYGKDVVRIVSGVHLFDFDYDEPQSQEELKLISIFLQYAEDIGDIGDVMESGQRVQIGSDLTAQIKELEKNDYLIFGIRELREYEFIGKTSLWDVAVLRILKKSNPLITSDHRKSNSH